MDGIIIVNKPKGYTSHDVVAKVKKITNTSKVGHTGTLDPNATGVLPILLGQGTKLSQYLIEHDKKYEVVLQLGKKTTTADEEGEIIEEKEVRDDILQEQYIKQVFQTFIGEQEQNPPIYSAIKIKGKKLYEYARKGITVEVTPRKIEIYSMELLEVKEKEKQIRFMVECSKGTYIRSLCEDIASKLETTGYMKGLNRLEVGRFHIEKSMTIEEIEEKKLKKEPYWITIEEFFKENSKIQLSERNLIKFKNGVKLNMNCKDGLYRIYSQDQFIGIGKTKDRKLKRELVLTGE